VLTVLVESPAALVVGLVALLAFIVCGFVVLTAPLDDDGV
jgi:hypothetical protein